MTDDEPGVTDDEPDPAAALASHAHTFAFDPEADPGADRGELAPLLDRLSGADAVGLGEATHGTREFVRARGRLVRGLVADGGFRTVALEARPAAATAVDEYVAGGGDRGTGSGDPDGDPGDTDGYPGNPGGDPDGSDGDRTDAAAALEDLRWFWRTEGTLALVRWLRRFNDGRPAGDRVRVRGVDVADLRAAFAWLREYLRATDSDGYRSVREDLDPVADGTATPDDADDPRIDDAEALAGRIRERIAGRCGPSPGDRSTRSARAAERATYLCRAVERTCGWLRAGGADPGFHPAAYEARDRTMADGVRSSIPRSGDPVAGAAGSGTAAGGVAVLAHDGHVQRGRFDDGRPWSDRRTMGGFLADADPEYRAVGTDFAWGRFRAFEAGGDADAPRAFELGDPPADSPAARLADLGRSPLAFDLRAASRDDRLADRFDRPRRTRNVGSVFDPEDDPERWFVETDLPASFDALVFVRETTPSRPIDGPTGSG